jgi:tetratricopeptide (TPR) repeat protein
MVNDPAGSERAVTRAVALLEPLGDRRRLARAYTYLAAILKLTDRLDEAIARARQALELGERTGQQDVVAHSLNYLGYALLDRGDPSGAEHLERAVAIARAAHHYEYAQRSYTNLVEGLYRQGRFKELDEPIALGLEYAREYGFASHEYNLETHRCILLTLRGRWAEAEDGLRRLLAGEDPGVLASFGLSALGRLPARGFAGCPPEYARGIEGDWRGAAEAWRSLGAPYEHALELAASGRPPELLDALRALDLLGAVAAADIVRRELRRLGVSRLPRVPCRARAPTPPGSPTARSRCSGCSPTGSPTRRSPTGWWCRCAPSTITSPPSSASSRSGRGVRRPAPTPSSGEVGTARPPV